MADAKKNAAPAIGATLLNRRISGVWQWLVRHGSVLQQFEHGLLVNIGLRQNGCGGLLDDLGA
jgi:hypothetical protein